MANPAIQTVSALPSGTYAPNTVITEYAARKYHFQTHLDGWLFQAPAPLTAAQIRAARRVTLAYEAPLEVATSGANPGEITAVGTLLGILIALGVLTASIGLIRSETGRDLRTLTATGPAPSRGGRSPQRPRPRLACSARPSEWLSRSWPAWSGRTPTCPACSATCQ